MAICSDCEEQFEVKEINGGQPYRPERESIDCPYCGAKTWEKTTGYFETSKVVRRKRKS